jgi:DNA polymerase-3 subunit alpha
LAVRAVERAKNLGQQALALTNHGNVFGVIEHYRQCNEGGIRPILGMEAYVTTSERKPEKGEKLPNYHQTLLVQNYEGYKNLMRLVTKSYDYFYYKPRIPLKMLRDHSEGLIVLSGCPSSLLQRLLQEEKYGQAEKLFKWFVDGFGDRFYAEVQHSDLTTKTLKPLLELADKYRVGLVATNDAHYVDPEDKAVHDLLLRMRRTGQGEENPTYGEGYHIATRKEMQHYLADRHTWMPRKRITEALNNTVVIAERVELDLEAHRPKRMLPDLWGKDAWQKLEQLGYAGLRLKGLEKRKEYVARLNEEMRVIHKLSYDEYFLVCHELTSWARSEGIMIGPRGSVCGSLLAFVLGVTMVDPIVHGTLFERFLHDEKKSFPDVDLDIDSRYKVKVHEWFHERFKPYTLPIITFGRYAAGNLVNDLQKAYPMEIGKDRRKKLRFAIDRIRTETKAPFLNDEHLEPYGIFDAVEADIPGLKRTVEKLYNMVRYIGRHPGGVCFVPGDAENWTPKIKVKDREMASFNYTDIEYLGLLKFDLLGLSAVSTVRRTIDLVSERHDGMAIVLDKIPLNDPSCYQKFSEGITDGIFQFETRGGRSILQQIEPDNFSELAASTALNRPGVSENVDAYVRGKREGRTHGFFGSTFGTVVYQEDIARVLMSLGLPWTKIDKFLKGIKMLKSFAAVTADLSIYDEVEALLVSKGKDPEKVKRFVGRLKQYSFNKAHAIGYSLVAYWMMWLRQHYPMEFWCSLLNMESNDGKRAAYEGASLFDGVVLLPPHINGTADYTIDGNAIRVGLRTIKGVGEVASKVIEANRPYARPHDLRRLPKRQVNARVVKMLAAGGALYFNPDMLRSHAVKYNVQRQEMNKGILLHGGGKVEVP